MDSEPRNAPVEKIKEGRFQLTLWRSRKRVMPTNDFDVEREVESIRVCIQHGRYNKAAEEWVNQTIWCNPRELGELSAAMEKLRERAGGSEIVTDEGEESVEGAIQD